MHHHALALPKGNSSGTHTSHGAWWTSTVWNSSFDGGTKNEKVEEVVKQLRRSQQSSSKRVTRATRSLKESSSFYDFFFFGQASFPHFHGKVRGRACRRPLPPPSSANNNCREERAIPESLERIHCSCLPKALAGKVERQLSRSFPSHRSSRGRSKPRSLLHNADTHMHHAMRHEV